MLDALDIILYILGFLFIRGIFISVLVILFARRFFRNRIETDISIQIIRWIILVYAFGVIVSFVLLVILKDKQEYLIYQTEPYSLSNLIATSIVPLTLLIKKLKAKIFYIFLISLLVNFAWLMESFAIHVPTILRDLPTGKFSSLLPFNHELVFLTRGLIVGLASLIIGNSIKRVQQLTANKS